jgi:hypothetical protein
MSSASYKNIKLYENSSINMELPLISLDKIEQIVNINELQDLEKKYDEFLKKKVQLLLLYEINDLDLYLDIRDALNVRLIKVRLEINRINQLRFDNKQRFNIHMM